jgi:hypothetical protein
MLELSIKNVSAIVVKSRKEVEYKKEQTRIVQRRGSGPAKKTAFNANGSVGLFSFFAVFSCHDLMEGLASKHPLFSFSLRLPLLRLLILVSLSAV